MTAPTTTRIDLRIRSDLKELLEEAAELSAQSVASFVTSTAIARAQNVVEAARRIRLTRADGEALLAALERPIDRNGPLGKLVQGTMARTRPTPHFRSSRVFCYCR